jgi:hypothetical protein
VERISGLGLRELTKRPSVGTIHSRQIAISTTCRGLCRRKRTKREEAFIDLVVTVSADFIFSLPPVQTS